MAIVGYYYLHENGGLIWKRIAPGLISDFENSTLVKAYWPCDPADRAAAWHILIEASALGADPQRVADLARQWVCTDADAAEYARREGIQLAREAGQFVAVLDDAYGRGNTALAAFIGLYLAIRATH